MDHPHETNESVKTGSLVGTGDLNNLHVIDGICINDHLIFQLDGDQSLISCFYNFA